MPPPNVREIYYLKVPTATYAAVLNLIEGHVGQGGIAIGIE